VQAQGKGLILGELIMIYVLTTIPDYQEDKKIIFASTSKEIIDAKLSEMVIINERMINIYSAVNVESQLWLRSNPPPPKPLLDNLPPLSLVLPDGYWENYYTDQYKFEFDQWKAVTDAKYQSIIDDAFLLNQDLLKYKSDLFLYGKTIYFQIHEVESD